MATTVDDCDAIDRACRAAGVVLMLGFTHRFHPELHRGAPADRGGRDRASGARPGRRSRSASTAPWPDWYYDRALAGGGELMHDAVHMVDRLAWLIDSPIVEVYGRTTSYARGIAGRRGRRGGDLAFAERGDRLDLRQRGDLPDPPGRGRRCPMPGRMELEIHGPRGTIRYRTWHELVIDVAGQPTVRLERADGRHGDGGGDPGVRRCGHGRRPPPVGAAAGRRGIAVIQSIYESERRGGRSASTSCSRSRLSPSELVSPCRLKEVGKRERIDGRGGLEVVNGNQFPRDVGALGGGQGPKAGMHGIPRPIEHVRLGRAGEHAGCRVGAGDRRGCGRGARATGSPGGDGRGSPFIDVDFDVKGRPASLRIALTARRSAASTAALDWPGTVRTSPAGRRHTGNDPGRHARGERGRRGQRRTGPNGNGQRTTEIHTRGSRSTTRTSEAIAVVRENRRRAPSAPAGPRRGA